MPTEAEQRALNFSRLQAGVPLDASLKLVAQLPPFPEDVKKRFPSMAQYEQTLKEWHQQLILALRGAPPANWTAPKPGP